MKHLFSVFIFAILIVSIISCEENETKPPPKFNETKVKQQFIKANQLMIAKENDEMDYYQKNHKLPFVTTTSGIRYYVYNKEFKGDSIKDGDILNIHYTISLLDGTECYSSKQDGIKEFKVGMGDAENGLHKAVLYLKTGDKALVLIPSYLAHGLLGDSKKIPPQSPIVYDIEILSKK